MHGVCRYDNSQCRLAYLERYLGCQLLRSRDGRRFTFIVNLAECWLRVAEHGRQHKIYREYSPG